MGVSGWLAVTLWLSLEVKMVVSGCQDDCLWVDVCGWMGVPLWLSLAGFLSLVG